MFASRRLTTSLIKNARNIYQLPNLPYDYNALEPTISRDIMYLHHDKHHRTYVLNLNAALEKLQVAIEKKDLNAIPTIQNAIKFNGGGHINHSIFWQNLSPKSSKPSAELCSAIDKVFGDFEKFKQTFSTQTVAIQGSGWGWLAYDPQTRSVTILTMPNQDALQQNTRYIPLLGVDVWEHAYYLQYQNNRAAYVKAIFDIINWEDVSQRYSNAVKGSQ